MRIGCERFILVLPWLTVTMPDCMAKWVRAVKIVAIIIFLSLSAYPAHAGVIFNAARDFSPTSNPNGVWSYGQSASLGSAFNLYTQSGPDNVDSPPANLLDTWHSGTGGFFANPAVFHNGTSSVISFNGGSITYLPGELGFHPGRFGQYSIVRFTAPLSASFTLESDYRPLDLGTTTDVHVLLNNVSIFDGLVNPHVPISFDTVLTLNGGDRLDFVVGVGLNGNYFADSTGLSAILTTSIVPEPSTLAIMLVGIGLGCCRRGPLAATLSRKIKMPRSGI